MRTTLADRAHEIRARSTQPVFRFRFWTLATATAVIVFAGLGTVQWFRVHHQASGQSVAQQPPTPNENRETGRVNSSLPGAGPQETRERSVSAARPQKTPSPGGGAAPRSELDLGKHEPEPAVPTPPADQIKRPPPDNQEAKVSPALPRGSTPKVRAPTLSPEQAVELYKLGMVEAPPYAFSGFASSGKQPRKITSEGAAAGGSPASTGRALFQKAMVAYVEGRYRDASDSLEGAAEGEPKAPDVNFYLGVCRLLLGHPDDSIQPLKKVIDDAKSPLLQSAHFYLAKTYLQKADLKQAETELQAASDLPGRLQTASKSLLKRVHNLRSALEGPHQPTAPR